MFLFQQSKLSLVLVCLRGSSYLVPTFQGPLPLLQHEALVFVRPLDVALSNFQALDDFPAVGLLQGTRKCSVKG